MNSFGSALRLTIWGESHGVAIGGVLDGLPPGMLVDQASIQRDLDQRRPGGPLASARKETDRLEIMSGVRDGHATGAPLAFLLRNEDARPQDYPDGVLRAGHGDWPAWAASNGWADLRGGGHGSGRLTAVLVAAGALVRPLLDCHGLAAAATLQSVGDVEAPAFEGAAEEMERRVATSPLRSAHPALAQTFQERIEGARRDRDSVGGSIAFLADGVPPGLGEPFFGSLESSLASLLFSIPAVVGVAFGAGFAATRMAGSDLNDPFGLRDGRVVPLSNKAGGVLGGRSTGAPVHGRVAIKPASSIAQPQASVNAESSREETVTVTGRHDPCIALRAVPVVAAALRFALADALVAAQAKGLLVAHSWPARGPKPA
ncbi:MAG: chorismate synthase [Candidatus Thermoplasmatota archaeon]